MAGALDRTGAIGRAYKEGVASRVVLESLAKKKDKYVSTRNLEGTAGAQNPIGAIGGSYKEGVGTRVYVSPRLLKPGEKKRAAEKKKKSFPVIEPEDISSYLLG